MHLVAVGLVIIVHIVADLGAAAGVLGSALSSLRRVIFVKIPGAGGSRKLLYDLEGGDGPVVC